MKFIAILRDSLREAIDTKIFYVTIGLSLLFVLFLFTFSFRPVRVEDQVNRLTETFTEFSDKVLPKEIKRPVFRIADFNQSNPGGEPWERNYQFDFVEEFPADIPADELAKDRSDEASKLQSLLEADLYWAKNVTVKHVPDTKPNELRFHVETEGSKVTNRLEWPHQPAALFGLLPMRWMTGPLVIHLFALTNILISWIGAAVTLLLSIVVTAFFIPNMLRKGTVDLLLAKPIHRPTLLIYKFIGGMTFMVLNTGVILGGMWLALGVRTGVWMNGLLLCIGVFTFQFAIFYAVSTCVAVTTRSPVVAILASVVVWGMLFAIGWGYRFIDGLRPEKVAKNPELKDWILPGWAYTGADVLHFATPHYKDLDQLTTKLLLSDLYPPDSKEMKGVNEGMASISWTEAITVTALYIALMLGFSCWWFASKDY